MADWQSGKTFETTARWAKLLSLPASDRLQCLYNGNYYKISNLVPIYKNQYSQEVDEFEVKETKERLDVRLLRAFGDGIRCSLMKKD